MQREWENDAFMYINSYYMYMLSSTGYPCLSHHKLGLSWHCPTVILWFPIAYIYYSVLIGLEI